MKKWIYVIVGLLVLANQMIGLYLISTVNSKLDLNNTYKVQENKEENIIEVQRYESPVMNLQQAATYWSDSRAIARDD